MTPPRIFLLCLVAISSVSCSGGQSDGMVFASWGGTYQAAVEKAWVEPFTQETGIVVLRDTEPEVARIRAMVESGSIEWDVVTGGSETLMRGVEFDLFVELGDDMVDQSAILPEVRNRYGVASEIFSTVIAYSTDAFPGGGPKTFEDFFNVEAFPGRRALPDRPATVIEAALMADGVAADQVYEVLRAPGGYERALNKIRQIRDHVAFWWSNGAQPVQALGSGEVAMALGWNGRFQSGIDDGLALAISWDESVAQAGYFMIPQGAPNQEKAMQFLNYIARPEVQARLSEWVAYGPTTPAAWQFIDPQRAATLPSTPERLESALIMDIRWWSSNANSAAEAYTAMLQE